MDNENHFFITSIYIENLSNLVTLVKSVLPKMVNSPNQNIVKALTKLKDRRRFIFLSPKICLLFFRDKGNLMLKPFLTKMVL